jgi:hypothetical protein
MMLGHALGPCTQLPPPQRRRRCAAIGIAAVLLFVAVRFIDGYGNSNHWSAHAGSDRAWIAFLACQKYPPSRAVALMTLGPGLLLLAAFDGPLARGSRWLAVFGRVPLFFYVVHIYLAHLGSRLWFWLRDGAPTSLFRSEFHYAPGLADEFEALPDGFTGIGLPAVYGVTAGIVLVLFPLCRWYGGVKRRGTSAVWSYL